MRWYQRLWYINIMARPARERFSDTSVSEVRVVLYGGIGHSRTSDAHCCQRENTSQMLMSQRSECRRELVSATLVRQSSLDTGEGSQFKYGYLRGLGIDLS
jgi:hypothetical protein